LYRLGHFAAFSAAFLFFLFFDLASPSVDRNCAVDGVNLPDSGNRPALARPASRAASVSGVYRSTAPPFPCRSFCGFFCRLFTPSFLQLSSIMGERNCALTHSFSQRLSIA
jgi:hypothetical protein